MFDSTLTRFRRNNPGRQRVSLEADSLVLSQVRKANSKSFSHFSLCDGAPPAGLNLHCGSVSGSIMWMVNTLFLMDSHQLQTGQLTSSATLKYIHYTQRLHLFTVKDISVINSVYPTSASQNGCWVPFEQNCPFSCWGDLWERNGRCASPAPATQSYKEQWVTGTALKSTKKIS